jgi:hypothetical protein
MIAKLLTIEPIVTSTITTLKIMMAAILKALVLPVRQGFAFHDLS